MIKFCPKCQCETDRSASGICRPCNKARNAAWRSANLEKVKAKYAAWRAANREKRKAYNAAYHATNKESENARCAAWKAANKEKVKIYNAAYAADKTRTKARSLAYYAANRESRIAYSAARRAAHPEKVKASDAAWRAANPDAVRVNKNNRRARARKAGGSLSPDISQRLFKLQRGKCPCCGLPLGNDYHIDHIVPLALGGENVDSNIQLLRSTCNMQKHAKHPVDFMQQRGFLL